MYFVSISRDYLSTLKNESMGNFCAALLKPYLSQFSFYYLASVYKIGKPVSIHRSPPDSVDVILI